MRSIFFAPHSDDECLFGSFTLLKHQPAVVICCPSSGDYGDTHERFNETVSACHYLGVTTLRQWHGGDIVQQMIDIKQELAPHVVWAPSRLTTHGDHLAVASAAELVFGGRVRSYETYMVERHGVPSKVRRPQIEAPIDDPKWVALKHLALSRYQSQITHPRAGQFFLWDLSEFAEQP